MRTKEVKKWLIDHDVSQVILARECGVSPTLVSLVIANRRRSQAIVDALVARGMPRDLLADEPTPESRVDAA
jgi:predicted transcriptional regulator